MLSCWACASRVVIRPLVFFLQLGGFGLEALLALGPAFLGFLGFLLKGLAFVEEEVALGQHRLDLYIGDVARSDLGRRFGLRLCPCGLLRRFRVAGGHGERCGQEREENFFHIGYAVFW